jgi:hypothetical protein
MRGTERRDHSQSVQKKDICSHDAQGSEEVVTLVMTPPHRQGILAVQKYRAWRQYSHRPELPGCIESRRDAAQPPALANYNV